MPNTFPNLRVKIPDEIRTEYSDTISKLEDGEFKSIHFKKLHGHNVYVARGNARVRASRLLFTLRYENNELFYHFEELVENHDYHKSRILRTGVRENYLANSPLELANTQQVAALNLTMDDETEIHFVNGSLIEFIDEQNQARQARLPLVLSGPAGSGKTTVIVSILERYVENYSAVSTDQKLKSLYVTKSKRLVEDVKAMWKLNSAASLVNSDVEFKTYEELVTELDPSIREKTIVEKEDFFAWIPLFISKYKGIQKARSNSNSHFSEEVFKDPEKIYQELRIISGCSSVQEYEEYLRLGTKQCLFSDPEQKKLLIQIYKDYLAGLNDHKIQLSFYQLNLTNKYDLIVCDESQDFSRLQLRNLDHLSTEHQIVYCADSQQSLHDAKSIRPFLHEKLFGKITPTKVTLPKSFRCSAPVIAMTRPNDEMKYQLTQGLSDKDEVSHIKCDGSKPGAIYFLEEANDQRRRLSELAKTPQLAIVTLEEYKEEARELYKSEVSLKNDAHETKKIHKTELVYTVEEIKGLEYHSILAYRLYDDPIFEKANRLLQNDSQASQKIAKQEVIHRPKSGAGDASFGPPFNRVSTAFTRATTDLYIYQPTTRKTSYITSRLKKCATEINTSSPQTNENRDNSNTNSNSNNHSNSLLPNFKEVWLAEAKRLIINKNYSRALAIFLNTLNKSKEEFLQFAKEIDPDFKDKTQKPTPSQPIPKTTVAVFLPPRKWNASAKEADYLNNLLANFSEKNLLTLLNNKHALNFLFGIKVNNPSLKNFFQRKLIGIILENEASRSILFKVLLDNDFFNISAENNALLEHLCTVFIKYPDFADHYYEIHNTLSIKLLLLSPSQRIATEFREPPSPLAKIAVRLGKKYLKKILSNPKNISPNQLVIIPLLLNQLARFEEGNNFIKANKKRMMALLDHDYFYSICEYDFICFCPPSLHVVLFEILKRDPKIKDKITYENISSVIIDGYPLLLSLCRTILGREIFATVIENETLLQMITAKDLISCDGQSNLLSLLINDETSNKIIDKLLNAHPEWFDDEESIDLMFTTNGAQNLIDLAKKPFFLDKLYHISARFRARLTRELFTMEEMLPDEIKKILQDLELRFAQTNNVSANPNALFAVTQVGNSKQPENQFSIKPNV